MFTFDLCICFAVSGLCLISTGAGDLAGRDQGVEQCNLYVSCKFVNNKHCRFLTEIRICVSEGIWQCIELYLLSTIGVSEVRFNG